MYLHIGKDVVIKSENICKNLRISDKIIDVSDNNKKSLVIINKNNETMGYISNISSTTLGKRTSKYETKKFDCSNGGKK